MNNFYKVCPNPFVRRSLTNTAVEPTCQVSRPSQLVEVSKHAESRGEYHAFLLEKSELIHRFLRCIRSRQDQEKKVISLVPFVHIYNDADKKCERYTRQSFHNTV